MARTLGGSRVRREIDKSGAAESKENSVINPVPLVGIQSGTKGRPVRLALTPIPRLRA